MGRLNKSSTARAEDTRGRIVAAAATLFSRYGFKRTSVDLLAKEAEVAKPTVYAYFADKEAVFRAVVEHVCDELVLAAESESRRVGPIDDRIVSMLSAKLTRYFELVEASPHAAELVGSHGLYGADIVERADRAFLKLLGAAIAENLDPGRIGLTAPQAAAMLVRAASGAAYDATSVAIHRKHLAEIVRALVASMRRDERSSA